MVAVVLQMHSASVLMGGANLPSLSRQFLLGVFGALGLGSEWPAVHRRFPLFIPPALLLFRVCLFILLLLLLLLLVIRG